MILFYTLTLILFGSVAWILSRRASSLESRYTQVASAVLKLANEPAPKPGNGKTDLCSTAKRTYELGRLVQKRDALEAKYYRWRGLADRATRWLNGLREWKGRKLPYTFGVLDVWLTLSLVDYIGVGRYVSIQQVVDAVMAKLQ
jgi:hypothetical protein